MGIITFFHQERADGGRRTGLYVGDERAFERFVAGDGEEFDPALRWYIEVICPVKTPPKTQTAAGVWLAKHCGAIRGSIEKASEHLEVGLDSEWAPWSITVQTPSGKFEVKVTAQRRYEAAHIGIRLNEFLLRDWPEFLGEYLPVTTERASV